MLDLNKITDWKVSLGLLPINLFPNPDDQHNYILLNGGAGDFCLQISGDEKEDDYYYSSAWSSNTKNFVSVEEDIVKLYNWRKRKVENIKKSSIEDNYIGFYKYLLHNSVSSDYDVVPFVLNIYRKLRNLINDKSSGVDSLNLLFLLLACYEDGVASHDIDQDKWGLTVDRHSPYLGDYINEFGNGLLGKKPDVGLLLRHSSGVIFQEAQREALLFDKNLDLFTGTISSLYSTRKLLYSSIHYTPSYLARTIVENALNEISLDSKEELHILDPSCGSSEFLMEALKQLKSKNYKGKVYVTGWDTSISATNTSKYLLFYEKREWGKNLSIEIKRVDDSLLEEWQTYDCILMNPPFVSWEQMPKDARESTRNTLAAAFNGRPNQSSAFFQKAINSLKADGVFGCVMPSSILISDSYKKLRVDTLEKVSLKLVGKLGNFIFEDALTDVSILIGKKPKQIAAPLILWTRNDKGIASDALRDLRKMLYTNLPSLTEKEYSIYRPINFPFNKDDWKLISFNENSFLDKIDRSLISGQLVRVEDVFDVQQGIRSGSNSVFKLKPFEFDLIPEPEKKYFRPVVDNESIKSNVLYKRNYIWYPYNANGLILKSEEEVISSAPYFFKTHLVNNKQLLSSRKGISEWWGLTRPRMMQFTPIRGLITTEFGRSDSFAFDPTGEFVIERGNAWIPKKEFKDEDYFYFYLAIFSSPYFDALLSVFSKQLAGGYWYDLGKKYTKNIPIPKITKELTQTASYQMLVRMGKEIIGNNFNDFSLRESILKEFIYPSYDGI